jgi:hypothetical protein
MIELHVHQLSLKLQLSLSRGAEIQQVHKIGWTALVRSIVQTRWSREDPSVSLKSLCGGRYKLKILSRRTPNVESDCLRLNFRLNRYFEGRFKLLCRHRRLRSKYSKSWSRPERVSDMDTRFYLTAYRAEIGPYERGSAQHTCCV